MNGYNRINSFSGSYWEGITSELDVYFMGTKKVGQFTIKSEDGAIIVILVWDHLSHRIVLLDAEKQTEGTIYDFYTSSSR